MRAASVYVAAIALVAGACSGDQPDFAVALDAVPAGLEPSADVTLPMQGAAPDFELSLYSASASNVPAGALLGVFSRARPGDVAPHTPQPRDGLGPAGLAGVISATDETEVLLVSRDLGPDQLSALSADASDHPLQGLAGWTLLATQERATVPGTGAIPIALGAPGHVVSYISTAEDQTATGFQRSVAIGRYAGSESDLEVLRWWYGNSQTLGGSVSGRTFQVAAFEQTGNDATGEVPTATVTALWAEGTITIIRTVGLDEGEIGRIVDQLSR
jgi:hypothetical protein